MNYSSLKLYVEYNSVRFTKSPIDDKFLSFLVISENDNTLSSISHTKFDGEPIRNYIVPTSFAPFRTYMNSDYKTGIKDSGYIPIKSNVYELNKFNNKHNFIDVNRYFDAIIDRMHTNVFNNKKYIDLFNSYIKSVCNYIPSNFKKNLLYTINIDNEFSDKLLNRRILPLYLSLLNNEKIPLDKIFIVYYSVKNNTKEFILLYDSEKKENISKIRSILLKHKYNKKEEIVNDEIIGDDMFDFDEDEIKTATEFKESYSAWTSGAMNVALNEGAWGSLISGGSKFFASRAAKAAAKAATSGAEVAVKKPNILRRAATGVGNKVVATANTAKSVKDEVVNVAKNPMKLINKRVDTPLDPKNRRAFDFARNPNEYMQRYYAGTGAAKNSSVADKLLTTTNNKLSAAQASVEQGGKAVRTNYWNPFSSKVTANVNDIKKYEDEVLAAKNAATGAAKTAEELKFGGRAANLASRAVVGQRPIVQATTGIAGGAVGTALAYSSYNDLYNMARGGDARDKEIADKQNEIDKLYGYIGDSEQQQQQQPEQPEQPQQQVQPQYAAGYTMPPLSNAGKVAVAGAGVAAGVGIAYAAWQRAKQKKEERYYASGCSNLQGGQLASCIQSVNNLKLKNLQSVLSSCGPDQQCIQNTNAELDAVQQAMQENRMAD